MYFTDKKIKGGRQIATLIDREKRINIYMVVDDNDPIDNDIGIERLKNKMRKRDENKYESIKLDKGKFLPYPSSREFYISGTSGCGKTYLSCQIIKEYLRDNKKNDMYVLSGINEDKVVDDLKPKRIKLDERMHTDPLEVDDFKDSIVLFDDIKTISNNKIAKSVAKLRDNILEKGRHTNTTIIATTHLLLDYQDTRLLLVESSNIIFFPKGGGLSKIDTFLEKYVGVKSEMRNRILSTKNSRWVMVHNKYPQFILTEKELYFI